MSDTTAEQTMMHTLKESLLDLIHRLQRAPLIENNVIPWSCPVPSFGDISTSVVATLGLNPSNREFVDNSGNELEGRRRRLHTLRSLGLDRWRDLDKSHLRQIMDACLHYFSGNPYLGWFGDLDKILLGAAASYYDMPATACHLDLIPYATACKWTELTGKQQAKLLDLTGDTLGILLRASPIRLLLLNGMTVTRNLERLAGVEFETQEMKEWTLPRRSGVGVIGYAFRGLVREIGGVKLTHPVRVLGYNHNIQSSFGVTTEVKAAIKRWVAYEAKGVFGEGSRHRTRSSARFRTSLFSLE